jgi:tRNA threonylcarbamoyladenosine biosynthesis protein TsaB
LVNGELVNREWLMTRCPLTPPTLTIPQFTIPQLTIIMLLSLDTATRHSGLALYDGQQIVAELNWHSVDAQTTELLPRLEQVMVWSGVRPAGLTAIAVSLGPGSFTGLRVAISLAKGMALAHGLPMIGVPTLDATAYPHLSHGEPVCAVVQAGRGRVLWSIYQAGPSTGVASEVELGAWRGQRTPTALTDGDRLAAAIDRRTRLVGELTPDLRSILADRTGELAVLAGPAVAVRRAGCVAELAWLRWQAGQMDDPATLNPIYLHEP